MCRIAVFGDIMVLCDPCIMIHIEKSLPTPSPASSDLFNLTVFRWISPVSPGRNSEMNNRPLMFFMFVLVGFSCFLMFINFDLESYVDV